METAFAKYDIHKALATVQPEPPRQSAVTIALQKLADTNTAQLNGVDALILTAAKNATIGEMQPTEIAAAVNQCFRFISIDVGYKRPADDAEWQYIIVRLSDVLKRHFYDLTIEDVKTAFELLTVGDLDNYLPTNNNGEPDRSHYQNLNAEYLCKVLRAYKKRRDVAYTNIKAAQPKPQKTLPPQPTKTPAEKTRECYDNYKATGKLVFVIPPDDVTIANFLTEKGLMAAVEITDADKEKAFGIYKAENELGLHNDYAARWIIRAGKDAREIQPKAYKLALNRCIKTAFDGFVSREKNEKSMIPKTLHYMWFGGKQMPQICKECIESWHKVLPSDWSFQFWNEDNYDVEINNFVLQAYSSGNYAFVSDYARWDILHRQGGVYVDTDVFLLKDITPLLQHKAFGGQNCSGVFASGLILGAEPNLPICKEMMAEYDRRNFLTKDGKPTFVTNILIENGLLQNKYNFKPDATEVQTVADITIYPTDYFCPFSPADGTLKTTANTYAVHQFTGTWMPEERKAAQAKANPKLAEHYKKVK